MKVLFLDFDGVLHPASTGHGDFFSKAPLLAETLGPAEIPVIVSSSWRFTHTLHHLKNKVPPLLSSKVVDVTGPAFIGKHARHQEILAYLSAHPQYTDWRALDDSYWEFPNPCKELIKCNPNSGIGSQEVKVLKEWLHV